MSQNEPPDDEPQRRLSGESDRLLETLNEVRSLEQEKRQEDISTPRFHDLARQITDKAHEVFRTAYVEEIDGDRTETTDHSIEETARSGSGADPGDR